MSTPLPAPPTLAHLLGLLVFAVLWLAALLLFVLLVAAGGISLLLCLR